MTRLRPFLLVSALALAGPALAQSTTGDISVAQVMEALENAPANDHARQLLTAYLSGIGETTGALLVQAADRGLAVPGCRGSISLSWDGVAHALTEGVPDAGQWQSTPATPIIVADMLARAGCH